MIYKDALSCSFLTMFGVTISDHLSSKCKLCSNVLKSLVRKDILFKNGEVKLRHPRYALEFLVYIFESEFENDFQSFNAKYGVCDILKCLFKNVNIDESFNILFTLTTLNEERYRLLIKAVIQIFVASDHTLIE